MRAHALCYVAEHRGEVKPRELVLRRANAACLPRRRCRWCVRERECQWDNTKRRKRRSKKEERQKTRKEKALGDFTDSGEREV